MVASAHVTWHDEVDYNWRLFRWSRKASSCVLPCGQIMVSSTHLSQSFGSRSGVTSAVCSYSSIKTPATTRETGDPIAVPSVCSKNWSPYLKYVDLKQSSVNEHTCCSVMAVISLRDSSCSSLSLMMIRASSTGTWEKRFFTSKLTRQSLLSIFRDEIHSTKCVEFLTKQLVPSERDCWDCQ